MTTFLRERLGRDMLEKIIRYTLRITSAGHIIEVVSAVLETAYITATLALLFGIIELCASFYIKECDC